MSNAMRYRNPVICEHLASQYVAGAMSDLTQMRMTKLLAVVPELERAVAQWSDALTSVHERLPEKTPAKSTWKQIEARISSPKPSSSWPQLLLWKIAGLAGLATSLVLATLLVFSTPDHSGGPNYLATMSTGGQNVEFIISAYKMTEDLPSRLHVQWSKHHPRTVTKPLHLWAEDRTTGALTYIGVEPGTNTQWALSPPHWKAISNSGRLYMTTNEQQPDASNTVFSGPCIQLGDWAQG